MCSSFRSCAHTLGSGRRGHSRRRSPRMPTAGTPTVTGARNAPGPDEKACLRPVPDLDESWLRPVPGSSPRVLCGSMGREHLRRGRGGRERADRATMGRVPRRAAHRKIGRSGSGDEGDGKGAPWRRSSPSRADSHICQTRSRVSDTPPAGGETHGVPLPRAAPRARRSDPAAALVENAYGAAAAHGRRVLRPNHGPAAEPSRRVMALARFPPDTPSAG